MVRLEAPVAYQPSGRTEEEIRANIHRVPWMTFSSSSLSPEVRKNLRTILWEEIALYMKDRDEEEAYRENGRRSLEKN